MNCCAISRVCAANAIPIIKSQLKIMLCHEENNFLMVLFIGNASVTVGGGRPRQLAQVSTPAGRMIADPWFPPQLVVKANTRTRWTVWQRRRTIFQQRLKNT